MNIVFILELIGTVAFAVSGAMIAIDKKMDIFGVIILGMTTAVGGGIIRDVIIDVTPPAAFQHPVYALLAIFTAILTFLPSIRKYLTKADFLLLVMDTLGLGIFTVIGVRAGMPFHNPFLSIFVGGLTGVGGGVLRDLFAGNRPYIFVKHFYACASLLGAVAAVLCWPLGEGIAMCTGAILVCCLRFLAAKYHWSLPRA